MLKIILSLLLLASLQFILWFNKNGILEQQYLNQQIVQQQLINQKLIIRNKLIANEIDDLKNNFNVIEEYARTKLGMIKNNETFYLINHSKQ
jgi:cell division protein FtsB